jgi:CubicO group peptidase (beta-lactamase class C family)
MKEKFQKKWIDKIDNQINFSVNNGLSGAVAMFSVDGEVVLKKAYGYQRKYDEKTLMKEPQKMTLDTSFDLASFTKIFSTTLSYMKLVDESILSLDDLVVKHLPEFTGNLKERVTIKQLFQHNSGLDDAGYSFFNPKSSKSGFYSQNRELTIRLLPTVPLTNKPGSVTLYCDLNFMLLGIILEKVTNLRQDIYVQQHIYKPLGLKNIGYQPTKRGIAKDKCEASERCGNTRDGHASFPNARVKTIQGEVQDEKCFYSMDGVAGEAGLFSTIDDLELLANLILNKGTYNCYKFCSSSVVDLFISTFNIDNTYSIGFELPNAKTELIYGMVLPPLGDAVAHTGWTGKCFIIDFKHKAIAIILTNKKHSEVIVHDGHLNTFEGDLTPTGLYGNTMEQFFAGVYQMNTK